MPGWTAAAATVTVTPGRSVPLAGYASRTEASVGVLDELEVNILILRNPSGVGIGWVAIDSVAITPPLDAVLRRRISALSGLAPDSLIILASHTHSAPLGWVGSILPELPADVEQQLLAELHDALSTVSLHEESVELLVATTTIVGASGNRQFPDGPYDPSASVTLVRRRGNSTPLALLYDFACHPTVLGPDNLLVSADWVGATRSMLRAELGGALPVVFALGGAGDVSTRYQRRGRDNDEVERIGQIVAGSLIDALDATALVANPELTIDRRQIELPSRWEDRPIPVSLSLIRVGEQRFLGIPGEVCASLELGLVAPHPELRVISCADGYIGYLSDNIAHEAGRYEALSSPFNAATTAELMTFCAEWVAEELRAAE